MSADLTMAERQQLKQLVEDNLPALLVNLQCLVSEAADDYNLQRAVVESRNWYKNMLEGPLRALFSADQMPLVARLAQPQPQWVEIGIGVIELDLNILALT